MPPKTSPGAAFLVALESKQEYNFPNANCTIGRHKRNEVWIDDPYLSRFHARIVFMQGHYFIEDLGSTNGTVLNGETLLDRRVLSCGDQIKIGRTEFEFRLRG